MPPLSSTTAPCLVSTMNLDAWMRAETRLNSGIKAWDEPQITRGPNRPLTRFLDALQRRIPNELVDLKSKPRRDVVRQHPLSQLLGSEQAVRSIPGTVSVFPKCRREQYRIYPI